MTGRAELLDGLDAYLDAVAAGTPGSLALADGFRSTENGAVVAPGTGLWSAHPRFEGIQGFADPETGQAVCMGVAFVDDEARPFAQRIRVVDGDVTEAEAIVSTDGLGHFADVEQLLKPDIIYGAVVPAERRSDREGLRDAADRYWEGLQQSDGRIPRFNYRCDKYDNGAKTTNTLRTLLSPDGKVHTPASALNDTRAARPLARERRFPVLDTELGVAASFVVVDFHPIPDHPRPDAGSMYMLGAFKVVDGELRIIDEIREILPLGSTSQW
ncbi:hypothetical protein GCM10010988_29230 [Cnuibacter physcomitrellae]|uniref:DUF8021 domain-containing protein n=1 Tax=Cnuibacter physcomitrellae TaxID=1619308 RepID=A0A1X9LJU5_9MICO|nr:hypothetical protein [Cnuibacter physcomitrellae]ARJ04191.1 hypothetical protein B5808_02320 [Cnuibacter physcomitrellae]GGI40468.1 hypothetical protein GCM10010988_29230 [Cnuibacter physcomitrellae]